jgi:hypothetical protein
MPIHRETHQATAGLSVLSVLSVERTLAITTTDSTDSTDSRDMIRPVPVLPGADRAITTSPKPERPTLLIATKGETDSPCGLDYPI